MMLNALCENLFKKMEIFRKLRLRLLIFPEPDIFLKVPQNLIYGSLLRLYEVRLTLDSLLEFFEVDDCS